ncbi:MAG: mechanosensitive ion channel family protein [Nitrosopumilus sp.]|nr:mechanosensitive ion channel family protein [Nitrosopumilus sp.]MDF2423520.1 mechanosensitive ion channel family protein [Nitrosopumilus sp.]MDF2425014.1 mechanosensitive ion channel family protein [Nitrosopumilus sp.]MDF2427456.1 mechanosensitive ion channel family protein [Nitrosopumilus sp.]MDF2428484.1 mechanosensitive ion channel family protein [Nitrosopumilus sp.]
MVLDFLQSLSEIEIVGGLTLLSLFVGGIIMGVGIIIAKTVRLLFTKYYAPKLSQDTAKNFGKIIYFGIIIIAFLLFTSSTGVDLSGLLVAGGIFGIVIGFATQSVVSNLISGVFLMLEKPARQGDSIELPSLNISGALLDIGTFSVRIRLFDGTIMRVPNESVFTSTIRSLTSTPVRRSECVVGIAYKEDIDAATNVINKEIRKTMPFVLMLPKPEFRIKELTDSSVNIEILVWHPREDWGEVAPKLLKVVKKALDDNGIEIPFPQRVIWNAKE